LRDDYIKNVSGVMDMKRKIAVALILLFAFILNANLFERMFSTSKDYSISQGEVTT